MRKDGARRKGRANTAPSCGQEETHAPGAGADGVPPGGPERLTGSFLVGGQVATDVGPHRPHPALGGKVMARSAILLAGRGGEPVRRDDVFLWGGMGKPWDGRGVWRLGRRCPRSGC